MPNSNNQQNSGAKNVALVGLGALVGAMAAGAAWYFSEEERERPHGFENRHQPNHPIHRAPLSTPAQSAANDTDEKDGTVKSCEICFVDFEDLKQCGVQIVATPCGHVYCRDCLVGSLEIKPECPTCRRPVEVDNLRRLFL